MSLSKEQIAAVKKVLEEEAKKNNELKQKLAEARKQAEAVKSAIRDAKTEFKAEVD